ncbi:MAG: IPT/TIG domain-containing protein [Adhaeribacter sp.]
MAQAGNYAAKIDPDVKYYDLTGNLSFSLPVSSTSVAMNRSGSLMAMADPKNDVVTVYAATSPREYNLVEGNIYQDLNGNCASDAQETGLADMLVKAEPGPYYGTTDASGNYRLVVGKGSFQISPISENIPGKKINITCTSAKAADSIRFENFGNYASGHDFGAQATISPYLQVSVSSSRRRRCFRNTTTVAYGNKGFATAQGAQVTVQLPEYLSFISASIPHTRDAKGNYLFAVGDLQPQQQGTITLIDSVSCADPSIRGLTVCTKAWISPHNTYPAPASWNRADISVTGKTLQDSVARFVIRNNGPGDMTDSLSLRLYQDAELILPGKYHLAALDSLVLRFAPTGRVLRLEVDQPEGHPLKASAGVSVEVKQARLAMPSPLMMAYPPDDPEPEIALDCMPILDSFDPNDKQVVPAGFTGAHYTPTNTPLRYTIRFQNTGNDVAYRVVVVDTLPQELDLATLQVGAASHPFTYTLSGKGRPVLTFTFNNIMLPDSTRDPVGSNGFVQLSIRPRKDLPEKTKVENFADIFFDYNEPVRTNTTVNRIFDMPVTHSDQPLLLREVIASPALASFWPAQSRAGTVVTLKGSNFSPEAGANKVLFNNTPATVLQASATSLQVVVPAQAFSGKIKVITAEGTAQSSSDFVIFQPPTITALSATEGIPGAVITITGTHFSPLPAQDTVSFNGVVAKVLEATETTIKAEVPVGAALGRIRLKTLGGYAESPASFRVWYPPVISTFSPAKGKVGTPITITGSNFAEAAARNALQFEGKPVEVLEASETKLVVQVPAAAPSGKLRLQTPGGHTSSVSGFTFIPAPVITAITPARANAGATITITGENFQADNQADTVFFNDKPAKVLQVTPNALQVQAPKGLTSGTVVVAGAGGRAQASGFEVPELSPAEALSLYPNPTRGGITVNWFKADFTVEQMQVYNAIGKLVAEQGLTGAANDEQQLLLSQFGPGVYTFRFRTSAGTIVKRVVAL